MEDLTSSELEKQQRLRRMKAFAGGLLVLAAVTYLIARRAESAGGPAWIGYVRAAAEAGMVGGLADWFAVTALFRRPLGLPIPHTAIIPTRKDALGENLGDFVGSNFLNEDVIRQRLRRIGISARLGGWLSHRQNAERVSAEAATVGRAALNVLRDEDVQEVIERTLVTRLLDTPVGPPLGNLLAQIVKEGSHLGLVDLTIDRTYEWLAANRQLLVDAVLKEAPGWSPKAVDEWVAGRVYSEVLRVAGDVRADLRHPLRSAIDRYLAKLADDLREDPDTIARVETVKGQLLEHPGVRGSMGDLWGTARRMILDAIEDPHSELRQRLAGGLVSFGQRLSAEPELRDKIDGWLEDAAAYVVTNYQPELTRTITDTVERWDAAETSRKIELQVGRDLQFIRVNGTVVGSLAGIAIHAISQLVV